MDEWEESNDKSWGGTQPHFTKQYAKECQKLAHNKSNKSYKSSAAFQETPRPHTIKAPYGELTATTAEYSFTAAMEYTAALEEKTRAQSERILALEARVDGQTVLAKATEYAASAVTAGGNNKDLKELREMMKQLTASFTAQAATLASLSVKTHSDDSGGRENTEMKKAHPGLYVRSHCKREVYHKDTNCLELAANKAKRYTRCTSILE